MAKVKTVTIVDQNCHHGVYANNKKVYHVNPYGIGDTLKCLELVLREANVKVIRATAPYVEKVMLPDDLKKLKEHLVVKD